MYVLRRLPAWSQSPHEPMFSTQNQFGMKLGVKESKAKETYHIPIVLDGIIASCKKDQHGSTWIKPQVISDFLGVNEWSPSNPSTVVSGMVYQRPTHWTPMVPEMVSRKIDLGNHGNPHGTPMEPLWNLHGTPTEPPMETLLVGA